MCQIEITPDRLNRFPKTVPMNIREAILITGQALKRIREEAAKKAAAAGEKPQEPDPAPEVILPPPRKKRGRPRAKVVYEKS